MTEKRESTFLQNHDRVDVIFTIVSRGKGEDIMDMMREDGVHINVLCHGRGTAPSKILEMFGLGATEKDVVLSFVKNERSAEVLEKISKEMEFAKPGKGIAFTVPMQSIVGEKNLRLLIASFEED